MAARFSTRVSYFLVSLGLVIAAGCAGIPALEYANEDGGTPDEDASPGSDATVAPKDASTQFHDAGADSEAHDADILDAASVDVAEPNDPDGGDAGVVCGDHIVANCNQCAGKRLRCTLAGSDSCVSDCEDCTAGWLPCFHCNNNGVARGRCVQPNAKGKITCNNGTRCKCATAIDCPTTASAAETCLADPDAGADASTRICATCGEGISANAPCVRQDGTSGVCQLAPSGASCQ